MHPLVVVALLVVALGALTLPWQAPVHAQRSARDETSRAGRLQAWLGAVEQHRPGMLDRAVVEIASWSEDDLTTAVGDLDQLARFLARAQAGLRQSGRPPSTFTYDRRSRSVADAGALLGLTEDETRRGDVSRLVLHAALLHMDIATLLEDDRNRIAPPPSASSRRAAVLVLDGQEHGAMDRGPHWEIGRGVLDVVPADSPAFEMTRQWYVATAAFMQSRSLMADMHPHIARALQRFPADPDILFYAGSMHETLGSPLIQTAIPDIRLLRGQTLAVGSAEAHLQEARRSFERALEGNPHLLDARLRLGRTLAVLGRHNEAAEELRRALAGAAGPLMKYYAALFLGDAQTALGRHDEARESFGRAAALYPAAQSPRLAMSRLLFMNRRQSEAVSSLLEVLAWAGREQEIFDPWWIYFAAPEDEANRLLAAWSASAAAWERP